MRVAEVTIPNVEELLGKMNYAIRHRGTDDSGTWVGDQEGVFFGHQRLSILDISNRGHQPMLSPQGHVIVFNGEIYNHRNLRKNDKQYHFISETDTETILYSYEKYGTACLEHLNGMFAFAIWDVNKKKLFLARDRIGEKPLYYTDNAGIFAFSSEIKALLTLPWIRAELDEEALYHFLTFNRVLPPRTMFKNIKKFHPGHKMMVGREGIESYESYWEVEYANYEGVPEENLRSEILYRLEQSVKDRLLSDVPVGVFLSGGVDSSAVLAMVHAGTSAQIRTFSIGFRGAYAYDESRQARNVAALYNTNHHEITVGPEDIRSFIPMIANIYDEPLADATSIPIYFLSKLARASNTPVILTGDGSDELFLGYRNWIPYIKYHTIYQIYMNLPYRVKVKIQEMYEKFDKKSQFYDLIYRATKNEEFFWGGAGGIKESTKRSILSDELNNKLQGLNSHDEILTYRNLFKRAQYNINDRSFDFADWMSYLGLKAIVPNFYMYRSDHMGMAHAVEIRVPFLDYHFVNMAMSIPGRLKVFKGEPKYILKKALEPILPASVLYRKKQGFCVPLHAWAGDILLDGFEKNVSAFCRDTGLFKEDVLRYQIRQMNEGNQNYTLSLWNLFFLMTWFKRWLL